jgi:hypothetical protein
MTFTAVEAAMDPMHVPLGSGVISKEAEAVEAMAVPLVEPTAAPTAEIVETVVDPSVNLVEVPCVEATEPEVAACPSAVDPDPMETPLVSVTVYKTEETVESAVGSMDVPLKVENTQEEEPQENKGKVEVVNTDMNVNTVDEQPIKAAASVPVPARNSFDEQPIGGGGLRKVGEDFGSIDGAFAIPEQGSADTAPVKVDTRPLEERISDKAWKARMGAFSEIKSVLSGSDGAAKDAMACDTTLVALLPKMVADCHAAALDLALDAAVMVLEQAAPALAGALADVTFGICKGVVDKAFPARASTQAKGKAVLLKLMEVTETAPTVHLLMGRLNEKKIKIPPMCLQTVRDALVAFGALALPVKEVISSLGAPLGDIKVAATRDEAMALAVELHRWAGRVPLKSLLDALKTAQQTEFDKLAEAAGKTSVPTVYLRSQRPSDEERAAAQTRAASPHAGIDPKTFLDDVDLPRVLKATDFSSLVNSEKWSDQLTALNLVVDAMGPLPKLKAGTDLSGVLSACKTTLRNPTAHVQLNLAVMRILGLLSEGLPGNREVTAGIRPCVRNLVQKSKDRKLCTEVGACLFKLVTNSISFESLGDEFWELVNNKKTPGHTRLALLGLLRCLLQSSPESAARINAESLKVCADAAVLVSFDSDPKVRECAAETLCVLFEACQTRGKTAEAASRVLRDLEGSNSKVYKRMLAGPAPPASATPATTTAAVAVATAAATTVKVAKTTAKRGSSSSGASTSTSTPEPVDGGDDEPQELHLSDEEVVEKLAVFGLDGWASDMQEAAAGPKWQDKVEVFQALGAAVAAAEPDVAASVGSHLVSFMGSKTQAFKMNNMNVVKAVLGTCEKLAEAAGSGLDRATVWAVMKAYGSKLADTKLSPLLMTLFTAFAKCLGPNYISKRLIALLSDSKIKSPVAVVAGLAWLQSAAKEMGAGALPLTAAFAFAGSALENKTVFVRTAASEFLCSCFNQLGPRVNALVAKYPDAIQTSIKSEFAKVGFDPAAAKAVTVVDPAVASAGGADGGDDELVRIDLATLVDKTLLADMSNIDGKTSWQTRKAAIEALSSAIDNSGYWLAGNKFALEVAKELRTRMSKDTQANIKPLAVMALGRLLAAMPVEAGCKLLRVVAQAWVGGMAENKKTMRDATVASLQIMVMRQMGATDADIANATADAAYMGCFIAPIAEALTNPVGRAELLDWFCPHVGAIKSTQDCTELAPALVLALQDKIAGVRAGAEQTLLALGRRGLISVAVFDRATRDLPPASMRALKSTIAGVFDAINGVDESSGGGAGPTAFASASTSGTSSGMESTSTTSSPAPKAIGSRMSTTSTRAGASPAGDKKDRSPCPARPSLASKSAAAATLPTADTGPALKKTSKARRLEEFYKINWPQPPAEPSTNEFVSLKSVWEPLLNGEISEKLFPTRKTSIASTLSMAMDEVSDGVAALQAQLSNPLFPQHLDLALRWMCCVLSFRETSGPLLKLLGLFEEVLAMCRDGDVALHDSEITSFLPHCIERSGHKSERHRVAYKAVLAAAGDVVAPNRLCQLLLQGLACKNKKTRVVCLQEMQRVVQAAGAGVLGRAGAREVGSFLDSKDNDVAGRSACLDLCFSLFAAVGSDMTKLHKSLGGVTDRMFSMVEERIKQRLKSGPVPVITAPSCSAASTKRKLSIGIPGSSASPAVSTACAPEPDSPEVNPFQLQMTPPGTEVGGRTRTNAKSTRFAGAPPTPILWANDELEFTFNLDHMDRRGSMDGVQGSAMKHVLQGGVEHDGGETMDILSELGLTVVEGRVSLTAEALEDEAAGTAGVPAHQDVYSDIVKSLDLLLQCPGRVASTDTVQQNARESLKVLHSIVTGKAVCDAPAFSGPQSSAVIVHVTGCLRRAFELPVNDCALEVDLSFASVSLAVLFACIRAEGGACFHDMSPASVSVMAEECLRRIVDPVLTASASEDSAYGLLSDGEQILKAINLILITLGTSVDGATLCVTLLRILKQCVPETAAHQAQPMPDGASRPTSRLLLKVVKAADKAGSLFDFANLPMLTLALHTFFDGHPSETNDLAPFSAAKTVMDALVQTHGHANVLSVLQAHRDAGSMEGTAFVVRLVCRIADIEVPSWTTRAVAVVGKVKVAAYSPVDGGTSLIDTENNCDAANMVHNLLAKPVPCMELDTSSKGLAERRSLNTNILVPPRSVSKSADFSAIPASRAMPRSSVRRSTLSVSSPRALLSDRVMGSLNSLTASLDLPSAGGDGDSDLAARLSRLKRMSSAK